MDYATWDSPSISEGQLETSWRPRLPLIYNSTTISVTQRNEVPLNIPIAAIPNNRHAMNSGQNVEYQIWQSFLNYHSIMDTSQ